MHFLKEARLSTFFIATFLWSWTFFAQAVPPMRRHGLSDAGIWPMAALLIGAYGPTLVALALTFLADGRPGVGQLLRGFGRWRGRLFWSLGVLLLPLALAFGALVLFALMDRGALELSPTRYMLIPVALLAAVPFGPLAEEIGWRGFAQPRLLKSWSPLATGFLLGLAWALWHIPLFFAPAGTSISGEPITVSAVIFYLALLIGLSILMVALALPTGTHLLVGFLVHIGFNADLHRLLFSLTPEEASNVERWTLVPLWALIALLAALGQLRPRPGSE